MDTFVWGFAAGIWTAVLIVAAVGLLGRVRR